jgi:hypothetical protein
MQAVFVLYQRRLYKKSEANGLLWRIFELSLLCNLCKTQPTNEKLAQIRKYMATKHSFW